MPPFYKYDVFGLRVTSEFELPEARPASEQSVETDRVVSIKRGSVPHDLENGTQLNKWLTVSSGVCLYTFSGLARLLVRDGAEITVELDKEGSESDMRAFLLGSGLGTLLHQRKLIPMHVSAVETPSGIVAFTGQSGAGKSTIAGLLHRHTNWPLVCDDMAVVMPGTCPLSLYPGLLRLKLWQDAVDLFQPRPGSLTRDVARHNKFHVNGAEMFSDSIKPVSKLLVLEKGNNLSFSQISGSKAFGAVVNAIYRPELVDHLNDGVSIFETCTRIANEVGIYRFARPWSKTGLNNSIKYLAREFCE